MTEVSNIGTRSKAAVLILISGEESPEILYTLRSSHLRKHAGEVSFPGGRLDPGETPVEAALREAWEEVGLEAEDVDVIGELPTGSTRRSGFNVVPVLAKLKRPASKVELVVNPDEVAAAQWVALSDLIDPANRGTWRYGTHTGPGFKVDGLTIWGFTAGLTDRFLTHQGWNQTWDQTRKIPLG